MCKQQFDRANFNYFMYRWRKWKYSEPLLEVQIQQYKNTPTQVNVLHSDFNVKTQKY